MQYSFIAAAVLALTSSVFAQDTPPTAGFFVMTTPVKDQEVVAGSTLDIAWTAGTEHATGTTTITLLQGATDNTLTPGQVVVAGVNNAAGKFAWAVPSDLSFPLYGFKAVLDGSDGKIYQFSFPFKIVGSKNTTSSGTTTVHLGTGSAYTPSPTPTPSANSTTIVSTTSMNTTVSHSTPKPSSNVTMQTSITTVKPTTSGPTPTSSTPAQQSSSAAIANMVSGSFALAGAALLAFAL